MEKFLLIIYPAPFEHDPRPDSLVWDYCLSKKDALVVKEETRDLTYWYLESETALRRFTVGGKPFHFVRNRRIVSV
jgi:hypothetical protein